MSAKFEVGTLVILKSGGPAMTVTSLRDQSDNFVHCEWFSGNELNRDSFDAANLTTDIMPRLASAPVPVVKFPDQGCAACNWGRGVCGCVQQGRGATWGGNSNMYAGD